MESKCGEGAGGFSILGPLSVGGSQASGGGRRRRRRGAAGPLLCALARSPVPALSGAQTTRAMAVYGADESYAAPIEEEVRGASETTRAIEKRGGLFPPLFCKRAWRVTGDGGAGQAIIRVPRRKCQCQSSFRTGFAGYPSLRATEESSITKVITRVSDQGRTRWRPRSNSNYFCPLALDRCRRLLLLGERTALKKERGSGATIRPPARSTATTGVTTKTGPTTAHHSHGLRESLARIEKSRETIVSPY